MGAGRLPPRPARGSSPLACVGLGGPAGLAGLGLVAGALRLPGTDPRDLAWRAAPSRRAPWSSARCRGRAPIRPRSRRCERTPLARFAGRHRLVLAAGACAALGHRAARPGLVEPPPATGSRAADAPRRPAAARCSSPRRCWAWPPSRWAPPPLGGSSRARHLAMAVVGALLWAAGLAAVLALVGDGGLTGRPLLIAASALRRARAAEHRTRAPGGRLRASAAQPVRAAVARRHLPVGPGRTPLGFVPRARASAGPARPAARRANLRESGRSAFFETWSNGSRTSSKGCSAVPSPRRSSRSRSLASWRRRWTRTGPRRSPASTSPTSTRSGLSDRGSPAARGIRALAGPGAVRLPARARAPPRLRAADPARGQARDRRPPAPGRVRDPDPAGEAARAPGRGAVAGRGGPHDGLLGPAEAARKERKAPARRHLTETKAIVSLDDRRYVLDGPVASLGRSRECDCVFADPNISRKHAELRRGSTGDWQIVDLGSTNGVKVNGRQVDSSRLSPGRRGHPRHDQLHLRHRALADGHRADRGSAQVRLPRRPLPVPALGRAERAQGAAPTTAPAPEATGFHPVGPGGRGRGTDASLVVLRAAAWSPASASTCSAGSRSAARPTPTCGSRTGSPRGSTRASTPARAATTLRT